MTIHRLSAQVVAIEDLDLFCIELLLEIPASADAAGNVAAEARLYSSPTHGVEPAADEEWREYVVPDLRELFHTAVEVVRGDLRRLPKGPPRGNAALHLPVENLEAWVHALNQARLALTARHRFSEDELDRNIELEGGHRAMVLFRVHFYGLLQELFLRQMD